MSQRPRICLIDDDQFVRDALSLGLSDHGFDVVCAPGGFAGLDLIRREGADAVITDMNMPGYSGADLIVALRAEHPALPILAISGAGEFNGRSLMDLATEAGANACLMKPFRAREAAVALEKVLAARV